MKRKLFTGVIATVLAAALVLPGCTPAKKPESVTEATIRDLANDVPVQRAFIDGRWAAIQNDADFRKAALQENINEKRKMFEEKDIRPQMLELNLDMMEKTLADPKQKKRLMEVQMDLLEAAAKDPKLRPRLVAMIKDLLGEQVVKSEIQKITRWGAVSSRLPKAVTPPSAKQQQPPQAGTEAAPPEQQGAQQGPGTIPPAP
ncbi:MAG: hypothetical protein M0Z31_13785 [Clostridia bacterium]|nr:hypothetical protein [Clostridia bacterium]